MKKWQFIDLGLIDFREFLKIQNDTWKQRVQDEIPDTVIFAEHPPTISINERHYERDIACIRVSRDGLIKMGVEVIPIRRGGGAAIHAPGILGCYIVKKKVANAFLSSLGTLTREVYSSFGVNTLIFPDHNASTNCGKYFGAWTHNKKVATIGINHVAGVSQFGINFNVSPEPKFLKLIHPCGIKEYEMTSLALEGIFVTTHRVKNEILRIIYEDT